MKYNTTAKQLNIKKKRNELGEMRTKDYDAMVNTIKTQDLKSKTKIGRKVKVKYSEYDADMVLVEKVKTALVVGVYLNHIGVVINGRRASYSWGEIIDIVN